jgi:flavodoxin
MSETSSRGALVIFDSRYGHTWKVAEALARGLRSVPTILAKVRAVQDVHSDDLEAATLIAIGGPKEFFATSTHIREFFGRIGGYDLHGKFGFAFDTHARGRKSLTASGSIGRHMASLGLTQLEPRRSALTEAVPSASNPEPGAVHLAQGSEEEFEQLGRELGDHLMREIDRGRAAAVASDVGTTVAPA